MMPTLAVTFHQQQFTGDFNATDFISLSFSLLHRSFFHLTLRFLFFFSSISSLIRVWLVRLYLRSLRFKTYNHDGFVVTMTCICNAKRQIYTVLFTQVKN